MSSISSPKLPLTTAYNKTFVANVLAGARPRLRVERLLLQRDLRLPCRPWPRPQVHRRHRRRRGEGKKVQKRSRNEIHQIWSLKARLHTGMSPGTCHRISHGTQ
jgi:hypothetical protein